MTDFLAGQMSSDVVELTNLGEGKFALNVKLIDGRTIRSNGCTVLPETSNSSSPRSFHFDSEEFHKEVMKGNIDIRSVCAELERAIMGASK